MVAVRQETIKELGFLLRGIDYGDHHRILSFLTSGHGRVDLIALGAKKSTKRFAGILDFLNCLDIEYRLNPRGELGRLEQIELKECFDHVRQDYSTTMVVLQWNQLLSKTLPVGQKVVGVFELLHHAMLRLSDNPLQLIDLSFRRQLLSRLGFHLEISRCIHCQRNEPTSYRFSPEKGGLECLDCSDGQGIKFLSLPVSLDLDEVRQEQRFYTPESLKALRKIFDESFSYFFGVENLGEDFF